MNAFLIGQIHVNDPQLWQQYVEGIGQSLQPFDAQILFRGLKQTMLIGENPRDKVVVIKFSDYQQLQDWFDSDCYQALIPLRDRAADVVITTYQEST